MLQFAYLWVFALLPLPLLIRWFVPAYREPRLAVRVPFMDRLRRATGREADTRPAVTRRRRLQWAQLILIWVSIVAALARPQWLSDPIVRELPMRDLLVALDLSGSMETRDFTAPDGTAAERLTAAKQVLDGFLERRDGDRVGLIFFGSAAFVQTPFTDDLDVARELLEEAQIRMLGPRTVLGDAIGAAIPLFERSEVDDHVLIVLTDGNDTGSMVPPVRAAEIARDEGIVVYTVAMGDPQAAGEQALDEATLSAIAETTGGQYFHAEDRAALERVYDQLDELNPRQVETSVYRPQNELFHWPLGFAMLLSLALFGLAEIAARGRRKPEPAAGAPAGRGVR
ncbi:MAG: VWA domain-containing protein [Lysobacterales bacterium]